MRLTRFQSALVDICGTYRFRSALRLARIAAARNFSKSGRSLRGALVGRIGGRERQNQLFQDTPDVDTIDRPSRQHSQYVEAQERVG